VATDRLAAAAWQAASTPPGAIASPAHLAGNISSWAPAPVPGTAAGALRAIGDWSVGDSRDLDAEDWWFRTAVPAIDDGQGMLELDGLATLADVWLDDELVLSSANMFRSWQVAVDGLDHEATLSICFRALRPRLEDKHPRPRWKTRLVTDQALRWYRTAFLGRMPGFAGKPAIVGPWRPVRLVTGPVVVERDLQTWVEGRDGVLRLRARLFGLHPVTSGRLVVGDHSNDIALRADGDDIIVEAQVRIAEVGLWWPHTHGSQPLYDTYLELEGTRVELGSVGFRTIEVDRAGAGFALRINGEPVFCRGACWVPLDPVALDDDDADLRRAIEDCRAAGMNMLRLTGTMVYESPAFWDLCDELGVLVWQDVMLANIDPPDDEGYLTELEAELATLMASLQGRPSVAVVCGGSEIEQQAAMMGRPAGEPITALDRTIPTALHRWLPGVPSVRSTPSGGDLPFHVNDGIGHYYGVGAYLRPASDARLAGVRFTSECLAFASPPGDATVAECFGADDGVNGERWSAGIPRDRGAAWDFQDVTDHYVSSLHGVEATAVRQSDPSRWLDLARASVAGLVESTLSELRRPGSTCDGALIFTLRDLVPGPGWGLIDSLGRPKSSWFAARRVMQPVALLATDEGLNGWDLHVINDTVEPLEARLQVTTHSAEGHVMDSGEIEMLVPARASRTVGAERVLGAFRDVTYAYRFGPRSIDAVTAALHAEGRLVGRVTYLPGGEQRPREELGLQVTAAPAAGGWDLSIGAERLAQWVTVEAPGCRVSDSWFHLAAGTPAVVHLSGDGAPGPATVRALNGLDRVPVSLERS
jgi:beta-mannosidase